MSKRKLAWRINGHPPQVARLIDLNHHSRLDHIEQALAALGLQRLVDVSKAA